MMHYLKNIVSKKWVKLTGAIILSFIVVIVYSLIFFQYTCTQESTATKQEPGVITDYLRPEENTYLTFPEWYIVYSAVEYADTTEEKRPSDFLYDKAIGQFWQGYCQIYTYTDSHYEINFNYNLPIMVIGFSFTFENIAKGAYEKTIGWFFELFSKQPTQEEIYAQKVAKEYGNFLYVKPFYEFPFGKKLVGLWTNTSTFDSGFIRKIERKMFLSAEYGVRAFYGKIILMLTRAKYGVAQTQIKLTITNATQDVFEDTRIIKINQTGDDSYIIEMPRYKEFTEIVPWLASKGIEFVDIAGNDEILITVLVPKNNEYTQEGKVLFTMDVLSESQNKRVGVIVPVHALGETLVNMQENNITIEHLYDY